MGVDRFMTDVPAPIDLLIAKAIKIYLESVSIETREAFVQKSLDEQTATLANWLATKITAENWQINRVLVNRLTGTKTLLGQLSSYESR
jgi:hypothetical protein